MEYLVTGSEMKACDQSMTREMGVPSLVLMERAALVCVETLLKGDFPLERVLVVCGSGNNGGDGFAIARLLFEKGIETFVYFAGKEGTCTEETRIQKKICEKYGLIFVSNPAFREYTSIVDALLGIGVSRSLSGTYARIVEEMNESRAKILAVDIPSGLSADTGEPMDIAVRADVTVTFAYKKLGLILYPGAEYAGKVLVKDIGIRFLATGDYPKTYSYTEEDLHRVPKRRNYSNKGTFGKVLVIAGSYNMAGAGLFSAEAAYRMGAGLVQIFTEECNRIILQTKLPEAIFTTYVEGDWAERLVHSLQWADVVVFGPGIGTTTDKELMLHTILNHCKVPLIIDADGLNLLAKNKDLLKAFEGQVIVTPHVGEMARLTGLEKEEVLGKLLESATSFAKENHTICVLKDARTIVTSGSEIYINQSGNNGMATGGSGDVLSGIMAGLLAQNCGLFESAKLGVYIHGLAGDLAREKYNAYSMLAGDILEALKEMPLERPIDLN